MINVLDVFAGAGGFSLGFHLAGFNVVGAIEQDKWASETFAYNHKEAKVLVGDISQFSDEFIAETFKECKPDIILGGPPCQGFSICNKNAGDPKDPRNSLFMEMLRIAKIFMPQILVIENVPNLINARTSSKELVIDIIKQELEKLDYYVSYDILDAINFGIPQSRRRIFIIASKNKLDRPFPNPTHQFYYENCLDFGNQLQMTPSLWSAISDLPEIEASGGSEEMEYDKESLNEYQSMLREGSLKLHNHKAMKHSKRIVERFVSMSWGDSVSDVPEHLKPYKRNSNGTISDKVYDQNNRRMHPHKPCHTVPASFYANFVHPYKNRNFTAREGARIQSFPDWYVFKGKPTVVSHKLLEREGRSEEKYLCQYNQIGNAVPPYLAKAVADNILEQYKGG